jgi:UDP-glucose 4-epimerase
MTVSLVTGGAGFIGSHLVEALLEQGHRVRVLDNFSTGNAENLLSVRDRIEVVEGDITDPHDARTAMRGVDFVFHQAALASVPRSVADPIATHRACVDGTINVLMAAKDARVRRVVYAASSSAYGNSARLPKSESDPPSPLSPYAAAKLAGEHYCTAFSEVYGLETVRLRYFNVFGPRQTPDSPYAAVIPLFIRAMTQGKSPLIFGDGDQSRDFTFVDDVVQANMKAAETPDIGGRLYNVACGRQTSLLQLVAILNQLLGTRIAPTHGKPRTGDVKHSLADIERARTDLGYRPTTEMREGLQRCLAWWQQREETTPYPALAAT